MYCLFELLTVACLVVFVAGILFVVCAAMILVNAGIQKLLGLPAGCVREVARLLSTARTGWKMTVPDQLGSLISEEGKV
jgi:hypothetical protein